MRIWLSLKRLLLLRVSRAEGGAVHEGPDGGGPVRPHALDMPVFLGVGLLFFIFCFLFIYMIFLCFYVFIYINVFIYSFMFYFICVLFGAYELVGCRV